jgi:hypothetical protein
MLHSLINTLLRALLGVPRSIKTLAPAPEWSLRSAQTPKITNALVCYSATPTFFLQAVESLNAGIEKLVIHFSLFLILPIIVENFEGLFITSFCLFLYQIYTTSAAPVHPENM